MATIRTSTGTLQEVATEDGPMITTAGSRQYGLKDASVVGATQIPGADTYFYQSAGGMQEVTPSAGGGGIVPAPEAVYLPTVSSSPSLVVGMRRMVSAYSGALIQVQRASDNATMDVAQLANGLADAASVASWAAGSETRIKTWYDQSGNARHLTTSTWADMALYDAAGVNPTSTAHNAFKAAVFDGYWDGISNPRNDKKYPLPAGALSNRQNAAAFMVYENRGAAAPGTFWAVGAGPQIAFGSTASNAVYSAGGTTVNGRRGRQQYHTEGLVTDPTATKIFQDGLITTGGAKTSSVLSATVGIFGASAAAGDDFFLSGNVLGVVFYPATLSDTDANSVIASLDSTYGAEGLGSKQVVMVGDSILLNSAASAGQMNRTMTRKLRSLLKNKPSLYNMGISGQRLVGGLATSAATREFVLATDSTYSERILVIQIGTNDLGFGAGTGGYGATLYTAMTTYIGNARSAGYTKVLLCTILPRSNNANWTNPVSQHNIELADYNARVRANAAGADGIIDLAADPLMGLYATTLDTTYYGDGLHPTGLGGELLAPIYAAAINAIL